MPDLSNITVVEEILRRHGFRFSKSLGQNFIVNPDLCPRIAEESGIGPGVCALEIGPGIGVLTKELALRGEKVVAVELDDSLLPVLKETLAEFSNVTVISGDALRLNLQKLVKEQFGDKPFVVCANLPYYITSSVIVKLLEEKAGGSGITVMVQKEAAGRLETVPGSRDGNATTAVIHYYSEPKTLFSVPRSDFVPSPNVDSAVMRFSIREKPPVAVDNEKFFFKVVKAAFGQRRKTLSNALSAGLGMTKEELLPVFAACGLSETARAETLTLSDFANLAKALGNPVGKP